MSTRPAPTCPQGGPVDEPTTPWDPVRAAAERTDVVVVEDPVAALLGGGFLVRRGRCQAIVLDPALHPWQRRAALAHELVHAERGVLDRAGGPPGWDHEVCREERQVCREVAARLAPVEVVVSVVDRLRRAGEPVTVEAVAVELELPPEVAELALGQLG